MFGRWVLTHPPVLGFTQRPYLMATGPGWTAAIPVLPLQTLPLQCPRLASEPGGGVRPAWHQRTPRAEA